MRRGNGSPSGPIPRKQILIGLAWVLAVGIFYVSIRFIPLMDATLLLNTAAIFAPIIARVWDGRRESRMVWVGITIGFLGVTVVLRPGVQLLENPISLIGVLAGFFAGLRVFLLSKVRHEPTQRTALYSLLVGSVFSLLVMAAVGFPIRAPGWESDAVLAPGVAGAVLRRLVAGLRSASPSAGSRCS